MIRPSTTVRHSPDKGHDRGDDWRTQGECTKHQPDLWYADASDHHANTDAKAICQRCPVRRVCLADALARNEPEGIWGGLTTDQRKRLRRNAARKSQAKETTA